MDVAYSLRSRGDSFDSIDSFTVVSCPDAQQDQFDEYDDDEFEFESDSAFDDESGGDEWEDLGIETDIASALDTSRTAQLLPLQADAILIAESAWEPEPDAVAVSVPPPTVEAPADALPEPFECISPIAQPTAQLHPAPKQSPLSPSSRSRKAKEVGSVHTHTHRFAETRHASGIWFFNALQALKAFYLSKAKQTEEKRKLIVVHPPAPSTPSSTPPLQTVILPLKAPGTGRKSHVRIGDTRKSSCACIFVWVVAYISLSLAIQSSIQCRGARTSAPDRERTESADGAAPILLGSGTGETEARGVESVRVVILFVLVSHARLRMPIYYGAHVNMVLSVISGISFYRKNEATLLQSQSGRGAMSHNRQMPPMWDSVHHVLTRFVVLFKLRSGGIPVYLG